MNEIPTKDFETVCCHSLGLIDQNREYLQMHLSGKGDKRTEQALSDIEIESARIERAVNEMLSLLELSEVKTGSEKESNLCWFDLCRVVQSVEAMQEDISRQLGVKLILKTEPVKQAWLRANVERTEQIIFHLLSNALRACSPGGKVELRLEKKGENYLLTVLDNGCGLPKENRWQENRRRFLGGARLGLQLCRAYCEEAGWSLTLTDRKGRGTQAQLKMALPSEEPEIPSTVDLHAAGTPEPTRLPRLLEREVRMLRPISES